MSEVKPKPTAIITLDPVKGIQIKLMNWTGVSATMMDRMYHHLTVETQRYAAQQILAERQRAQKEKLDV